MLRNQKFAANTNIFGKVANEMNERAAANCRKNAITLHKLEANLRN